MSKTIKYDPISVPRKKNIFVEEYYSGVDCDIYINNELHENIAGIGFTVQEQLKPLYGYASRIFDDVAVGNRIVLGTIRIPIKNTLSIDKGYASGTMDLSDSNIINSNIISTPIISSDEQYSSDYTKNSAPSWVTQSNRRIILTTDGMPEDNSKQSTPVNEVTINNGNIGIPTDTVLKAQDILNTALSTLEKTGILDAPTVLAIVSYQKINNLPVTGMLDEATRTSLFGETSNMMLVTVDSETPLRLGPSQSFASFITLTVGQQVYYKNVVDNWVKISTLNGSTGYVLKTEADRWLANNN